MACRTSYHALMCDNRPIFVLPGGNSALSHRKELRTFELVYSPIWIGSVCGDVAWLPSARESPPPITRWLMSLVCAVLENRLHHVRHQGPEESTLLDSGAAGSSFFCG
ncbi:hypothetical protein CIHG_01515 [Coccidioides immitis H538.4]|uniref:Uncharacterized protein n=3 Tax=Coccidioides immitis TaxID=5501 RepID=A0A0J8QSP0_COCIT|nr:hypothetical protein CIRG_01366 [Coccidioides immitis RMSCC 2394]KMU75496.1 hypothetical protein CISG_05129 [Coccidioides immitis RMSCC 3703]KMU83732.1 hypothetical protein CIHG_01515 [Coccidioides immitis H538.4]